MGSVKLSLHPSHLRDGIAPVETMVPVMGANLDPHHHLPPVDMAVSQHCQLQGLLEDLILPGRTSFMC